MLDSNAILSMSDAQFDEYLKQKYSKKAVKKQAYPNVAEDMFTTAPAITRPNVVSSNLKKGYGGFAKGIGGLTQALGSATGIEPIEQVGKEAVDYWSKYGQEQEALRPSVMPNWESPISSTAQFIGEQAIQQIPNFVLMGATGGGAAAAVFKNALARGLTREAATALATKAATGAAFTSTLGQETGSIYSEQDPEDKSVARAVGYAAPAAALEILPYASLARRTGIPTALAGGARKQITGSRLASIGKQAAIQGSEEAATEFGQTLLEQKGVDPNAPLNYGEAGLAALAGGGIGAALGGFGGTLPKIQPQQSTTPTVDNVVTQDENVQTNLIGMDTPEVTHAIEDKSTPPSVSPKSKRKKAQREANAAANANQPTQEAPVDSNVIAANRDAQIKEINSRFTLDKIIANQQAGQGYIADLTEWKMLDKETQKQIRNTLPIKIEPETGIVRYDSTTHEAMNLKAQQEANKQDLKAKADAVKTAKAQGATNGKLQTETKSTNQTKPETTQANTTQTSAQAVPASRNVQSNETEGQIIPPVAATKELQEKSRSAAISKNKSLVDKGFPEEYIPYIPQATIDSINKENISYDEFKKSYNHVHETVVLRHKRAQKPTTTQPVEAKPVAQPVEPKPVVPAKPVAPVVQPTTPKVEEKKAEAKNEVKEEVKPVEEKQFIVRLGKDNKYHVVDTNTGNVISRHSNQNRAKADANIKNGDKPKRSAKVKEDKTVSEPDDNFDDMSDEFEDEPTPTPKSSKIVGAVELAKKRLIDDGHDAKDLDNLDDVTILQMAVDSLSKAMPKEEETTVVKKKEGKKPIVEKKEETLPEDVVKVFKGIKDNRTLEELEEALKKTRDPLNKKAIEMTIRDRKLKVSPSVSTTNKTAEEKQAIVEDRKQEIVNLLDGHDRKVKTIKLQREDGKITTQEMERQLKAADIKKKSLEAELANLTSNKPKKTNVSEKAKTTEQLFNQASKRAFIDYETHLKSNKSVGASSGIKKEIKSFVEQLAKDFNLSEKIFVTTESDIKASSVDKFEDSFKYIYDQNGVYAGMTFLTKEGDRIIALNDTKMSTEQHIINTLTHEIGHAIIDAHFKSASIATQALIESDYKSWLNRLNAKDKTALGEYYIRSGRTFDDFMSDMSDYIVDGKLVDSTALFEEYKAQQVAKYIRIQQSRPLGAIDRFFKKVADSLRYLFSIYSAANIKQHKPVESIENWLNDVVKTRQQGSVSISSEPKLTKLGDVTREYGDIKDKATLDALEKTGAFGVKHPTIKDKYNALRDTYLKKWRQSIVDQFDPIQDITKRGYMLMRLAAGNTAGHIESLFLTGNLRLENDVYKSDVGITTSYYDTMRKLQGEINRFHSWIAARRALELLEPTKKYPNGREALYTKEEALALSKLNKDKMPDGKSRALVYDEVYAEYNRIHQSIVKIAVESDLIKEDVAKAWSDYTYIPFFREIENGKMSFNISKGGMVDLKFVRELSGTSKKALRQDLMSNVIGNWMCLLNAAAKNRAANVVIKDAMNMRNPVIRRTSSKDKEHIYTYIKGQKNFFRVDDPAVLDAMTAINYTGLNGPIIKALGSFKQLLTMGVTASPYMKIKNIQRDAVAGMALNPMSKNPFKNIKQGFGIMFEGQRKELTEESQDYIDLLASGGIIRFGQGYEAQSSSRVQKLINAGVKANTVLTDAEHVKDMWVAALEKYNKLSDISEGANRAALWKQMQGAINPATGKNYTQLEATYAARDMLDFSMGGTSSAIRYLTTVIPFLNAKIQGLDKMKRGYQEDPQRFKTIIAGTVIASIVLSLAYQDDEEWKNRKDWDRDYNWWFKIGGIAYRIPKPFELGLPASIAERMLQYFTAKAGDVDEMTEKKFVEVMGTMFKSSFGVDIIPQAFRPMINVAMNKDSFKGTPIEGIGMQGLKPSDRYDINTTWMARGIGKAADYIKIAPSPVQVDYLVSGYFGWLGSFITGTADVIGRDIVGDNERPSRDLLAFSTQKMMEQVPTVHNGYMTNFYSQMKEVEQVYNTYKHLNEQDTKEGEKYKKDNAKVLESHPRAVQIKARLTELNRQIRKIENNSLLSGKQKREKIDIIRIQEEEVAKTFSIKK